MHEPTLDELLNEPVIRKVMAADGYCAEDIRLLMRQANARASADGAKVDWFFPAARTARPGRRCRLETTSSRYQPSASSR